MNRNLTLFPESLKQRLKPDALSHLYPQIEIFSLFAYRPYLVLKHPKMAFHKKKNIIAVNVSSYSRSITQVTHF